MRGQFSDERSFGFGWIADEPAFLQRASYALVDAGGVWLVDPVDVDGLDERVRAAGEPAGVLQLIDRHGRDGTTLARRYGVPIHQALAGGAPEAPFEFFRSVDLPLWREAALWWPERRTLVVGDALGTASYFLAPGERLGVHPLLRMLPPRSLARFEPEHVLCGHGAGVHGVDVATALQEALRSSRRRTPKWLVGLIRNAVGR
ncbi:MAG: hypothetical protein H0U46_06770 [Actinobacteria bacterium]|nr:hypothetical protein [Actinomycetota bacterium]